MAINILIPRIAAEAEITLPEISVRRYADQTLVFAVTGTADITHIDPLLPGQHILLIFVESAATNGIVSGDNLVLQNSFKWVAGDTLMLWCDGSDWRQPSSADLNPPPIDIDFYQTVKDPSGVAMTQRSVVKFAGSVVGVADTGGETVVTVTVPTDTDFNQTIKDPAGSAQTQRAVLKFTGSVVSVSDVGGETVVDVTVPTDTDYNQQIKDPSGASLTQRNVLKFVGSEVGVADSGGETVVTITPPTDTDYNQTIKNPAGSAATQRAVLKFTGASVTVSDVSSETVVDVTIPALGITTAMIAANAIHPAVVTQAGSGGSQTINTDGTTETVLVSKAYTVVGGVAVLIVGQTPVMEIRPSDATGGARIEARLYEGSNLLATSTFANFKSTGGTDSLRNFNTLNFQYLATGLSAGSHTFEIRCVQLDNTATCAAFSRGDLREALIQILEILK